MPTTGSVSRRFPTTGSVSRRFPTTGSVSRRCSGPSYLLAGLLIIFPNLVFASNEPDVSATLLSASVERAALSSGELQRRIEQRKFTRSPRTNDAEETNELLTCSWESSIRTVFPRLFPRYHALSYQPDGTQRRLVFYRPSRRIPLYLEIHIYPHSEPNAFAIPGESAKDAPPAIFITEGLLSEIRSLDELAFVLAHEMAHLKKDHSTPDLPAALFTQEQLNHIAAVHQDWELEADRLAIQFLHKAGFESTASLKIVSRLSQRSPESTTSLLRHHPGTLARLSAIRMFLDAATLLPQIAGANEGPVQ